MTPEALQFLRRKAREIARQFIPDEDLNLNYRTAKKVAVKNMNNDAGLIMTFILYGVDVKLAGEDPDRKADMIVAFADWEPEDKVKAMLGLGVTFAEKFPQHTLMCVSHVAEAWMVARPDEDWETVKNIVPSEQPDRVEVVIIHSQTADRRMAYGQFEIKRNDAGKFITLEPMRDEPYVASDKEQTTEDYLTDNIFRGFSHAKEATKR